MWQIDTYLFGGQLVHGQGKEWPEIFSDFKELKKPVYSTSRLDRLKGLAKEADSMSTVGPRYAPVSSLSLVICTFSRGDH